jgi:hypothetical protein
MTDHDDVLVDRLRSIAKQVDPPPELVLEAARSAFLMREIDAELAQLVLDSAEDTALAMRGSLTMDPVRMLSFSTAVVSVEVQVTEVQQVRTLLGMATGARGGVTVETPNTRVSATLDDHGRFIVEGVPAGIVRLHLVGTGGTPVTTSWVTL